MAVREEIMPARPNLQPTSWEQIPSGWWTIFSQVTFIMVFMISDDISYALNMGFGPPNLSNSSGYILSSQYYLHLYYYKTAKCSDQLFSAACSCSTRRNFAILGPLPPHPYLPLPGQRCVADADHKRWGEEFWLFFMILLKWPNSF